MLVEIICGILALKSCEVEGIGFYEDIKGSLMSNSNVIISLNSNLSRLLMTVIKFWFDKIKAKIIILKFSQMTQLNNEE